MSIKVTDRVWYDENPGKVVELISPRRARVEWDGEDVTEVWVSDLVKMTDYEANTAFTGSAEKPVDWYDLPTWIKGAYRNDKEMWALKRSKWTTSAASTLEYYYQYCSEGIYRRQWSRE